MDKLKSFTLIELIIIVGVLFILIAIAVPSLRSFGKESDLNNSIEQIIEVLRTAQNKTLASEEANQWGVHFETSKYVLFKGDSYNPGSSDNKVYELSEILEIYQITLIGGGSETVFERITGDTGQFGQVSLKLTDDPSETRTIYIENSGQAGLNVPPVPGDEERIKDARHYHFDLGWSIQDAASLKFKFLGPDPDQIETVIMANYFNGDKTEFDWFNENEPFVVNGANQVFQIHTHSLDAFNTILCIHRDRNQGENNEEVIIYIIDGEIEKDIAHYLADVDDVVEKGSYVYNSMERQ